ncbi:MAG TPA: FAD-dependent oxidoreductase [Burkholderiales bacterium]|nr:FAD-dependent oxidoreductase [Burkholderiales bacterium]
MARELSVRCCIAGGGPAGMMLGFLLARAGCEVAVLEKHGDFLRDFRGDTIHPSTLELMAELGLLEEFLRRPHDKVEELAGDVGGERVVLADFRRVPTRCKFVAFMPQWDFLDFVSRHARALRVFHQEMRAEAHELVLEKDKVVGLRARTQSGELLVRADLVVAADGRHSTLRERAGLEIEVLGAPMDVLWMRLPREPSDPNETFGHLEPGAMFVMLNRREYWQCAYVIPKGSYEEVRAHGLDKFRENIAGMSPFLAGRVGELRGWDDVKLLTVAVDRLRRWWRPGLLCIGDAAHAMSPIGGVGINLAIQDAVAAANILAAPLVARALRDEHLAAVQRRREFPTRVTQALQIAVQNRVISRVLAKRGGRLQVPLFMRLLQRFPALRAIPARLIGVGVRPEHVSAKA